MADLKLYEYEIGGVKHVAQMSSEDADRYKAKLVKSGSAPTTKAAPAPENKGA